MDGGSQVHLELGLGSKLQQHVDTRGTATAASIEEGRGSMNRHSIDLRMDKDTPRGFVLSSSPSQSCIPMYLPGETSHASDLSKNTLHHYGIVLFRHQ